jgi:hypothetical protein
MFVMGVVEVEESFMAVEPRKALVRSRDLIRLRGLGHEFDSGAAESKLSGVKAGEPLRCRNCGAMFWLRQNGQGLWELFDAAELSADGASTDLALYDALARVCSPHDDDSQG